MSNMYLDRRLDSRLAWQKFKLFENKQRLFLELLVNKFMQMFVESDDPNKGSAILYWLLMKYCWSHADLSSNHLLCAKTFKWRFLFLETFVHVLDKHINANIIYGTQNKMFADFVLLITEKRFWKLGYQLAPRFFPKSRALYLQKTVMADVPNVHKLDFLVLYFMVFVYKSGGQGGRVSIDWCTISRFPWRFVHSGSWSPDDVQPNTTV